MSPLQPQNPEIPPKGNICAEKVASSILASFIFLFLGVGAVFGGVWFWVFCVFGGVFLDEGWREGCVRRGGEVFFLVGGKRWGGVGLDGVFGGGVLVREGERGRGGKGWGEVGWGGERGGCGREYMSMDGLGWFLEFGRGGGALGVGRWGLDGSVSEVGRGWEWGS